jgi:allantoin racemase
VPAPQTQSKRIAYVTPGPMQRTALGPEELERRCAKLASWAAPDTTVVVRPVDRGPASIESMYEEYLSVEPTATLLQKIQEEGFDAAIVGCYGDPGLDGLREVTDMLLVGPGAVSIALASTLGHRFSIVTVTGSIVAGLRRLVWETGALDKLASIRYIETSVMDVNQSPDAARERMLVQARAAIEEDGADTLILGCMSMGFLDVAEHMTGVLGVPVINPSKAALKLAEATVALNLTHSRRAYHRPPKLTAGGALHQLFLD